MGISSLVVHSNKISIVALDHARRKDHEHKLSNFYFPRISPQGCAWIQSFNPPSDVFPQIERIPALNSNFRIIVWMCGRCNHHMCDLNTIFSKPSFFIKQSRCTHSLRLKDRKNWECDIARKWLTSYTLRNRWCEIQWLHNESTRKEAFLKKGPGWRNRIDTQSRIIRAPYFEPCWMTTSSWSST